MSYSVGEEREFGLHKTKRGLPALWEQGGGLSNTGRATVIAGPRGEPKRAVYIARKGSLSCGEHALIVVSPGDHIISARHHRRDYTVEVWRILEIGTDDKDRVFAKARLVALFDEGEWVPDAPGGTLAEAVTAAKQKAACYHCRTPHWVVTEE